MAPGPMVILIVACFRTEPDVCREVRWDVDPTLQCTRQRPEASAAVERLHPGFAVVSARCIPRFRLPRRAVQAAAAQGGPRAPAVTFAPIR